jgi:MSHA pilin protein MshC
MPHQHFKTNEKLSQYSGFTLIELVIVIIMVGILSVTVIPKMFTSSGYEEIGYQAETVAKLRAVQLRAMQDTSKIDCQLVYVTLKKLGIPDDSCDSASPSFTNSTLQNNAIVKITESTVNFDVSGNGYHFSFDQMGKPDQKRVIAIIGSEQTLTVTIEAEGYIHAN